MALPWIAFAIAIIVAGGLVFAAAMIAIGVLCLREFFGDDRARAAARDPRLRSPSPALIVAAHFGTPSTCCWSSPRSFPLLFVFGAAARHRDGVTVSIA